MQQAPYELRSGKRGGKTIILSGASSGRIKKNIAKSTSQQHVGGGDAAITSASPVSCIGGDGSDLADAGDVESIRSDWGIVFHDDSGHTPNGPTDDSGCAETVHGFSPEPIISPLQTPEASIHVAKSVVSSDGEGFILTEDDVNWDGSRVSTPLRAPSRPPASSWDTGSLEKSNALVTVKRSNQALHILAKIAAARRQAARLFLCYL